MATAIDDSVDTEVIRLRNGGRLVPVKRGQGWGEIRLKNGGRLVPVVDSIAPPVLPARNLSDAPAELPTATRQQQPETARRAVATPPLPVTPPDNPLANLKLAAPPADTAGSPTRDLRRVGAVDPLARFRSIYQQRGERAPAPGEAVAEFQKTPVLPDKKLAIDPNDHWLVKLGKEYANASAGLARGLTTPENLQIMGAMSAGFLPPAVNRLASAWFAAGAVGQIPQQVQEGIAAVKARGPTALPAAVVPVAGSALIAAGAGREAAPQGMEPPTFRARPGERPAWEAETAGIKAKAEGGRMKDEGTATAPPVPAPESARRANATPATAPKGFGQSVGELIEKHIGDTLDERLKAAGIAAKAEGGAPKEETPAAGGGAPPAAMRTPETDDIENRLRAQGHGAALSVTLREAQAAGDTPERYRQRLEDLDELMNEGGESPDLQPASATPVSAPPEKAAAAQAQTATSTELAKAPVGGATGNRQPLSPRGLAGKMYAFNKVLDVLQRTDNLAGEVDLTLDDLEDGGLLSRADASAISAAIARGDIRSNLSAAEYNFAVREFQQAAEGAMNKPAVRALTAVEPPAPKLPAPGKKGRAGEAPVNLIEQLAHEGIRVNVSRKGAMGKLYQDRITDLTRSYNRARALFTTQGGQPLDEAAQSAYNLNLISEPTGDALLDALEAAGKPRKGGSAETLLRTRDKQDEAFATEVALGGKGKTTIDVDALKVGDSFMMAGEKLRVKAIDPETGEVTVEDGRKFGRKFGRQQLSAGQRVPVDRGTAPPAVKAKAPPLVEKLRQATTGAIQAARAKARAFKLPQRLSGAQPRYAFGDRQFTLNFESDLDKALYILAQGKKSKADTDYLHWAEDNLPGVSEPELREMGRQVREEIKQRARDATPGRLTIPNSAAVWDKLMSESGAALNPAAVLGPAAAKAREMVEDAQDYMTIDSTPKLRRVNGELAVKAREHAYARASAEYTVDDWLAKVFPESYARPEVTQKFADVLNADNILGGHDRLMKRAELLRKQGASEEAAKFDALAAEVANSQDLMAMHQFVTDGLKDPEIAAAVGRWKAAGGPQDELDRWYQELRRVDPKTQRPGRGLITGARINLLPTKRLEEMEAKQAEGAPVTEVRPPSWTARNVKRDPFMRQAKLTGEYSNDLRAVLLNVVRPRWNNVTKLRLYEELVKQGAAVEDKPGTEKPVTIQGTRPALLPVEMPETGEGGLTKMVPRNLWLREDLLEEVRNALRTDLDSKMNPFARGLNELQLAQFADPVAHAKNQHTLVANLPAIRADFQTVARKMPVMGTAWAAKTIGGVIREINADTPALRDELAGMARAGLLRQKSRSTGVTAWLGTHDALQKTDLATRVIMNRFFTEAVNAGLAKDTALNRAQFVTQVGEYNTRLMGDLMKRGKQSGLAPFIVAGRNFNRSARRLMTGAPGFEAANNAAAVKVRLLNLATGVVAAGTLTAMLNTVTTGHPGGRAGTPLGAWDLGRPEKNGKHTVLDVLQLTGLRRALRGTGVNALVEGARAGKDWNHIGGDMVSDVTGSFAHPFVGPAVGFASQALTGRRIDMRGGPQPVMTRNVGGGLKQYGENLRVSVQNSNPLLYAGIGGLLGEKEQGFGERLATGLLKAPGSALGIQELMTPAMRLAGEKTRALAPEGGYTEKQGAQAKFRRDMAELMATNPAQARTKFQAALRGGQATVADADAIWKLSRETLAPLQSKAKRLASDDPNGLMEVYQVATDDEKREIRRAVAPQGLPEAVRRATSGEKVMLVWRLATPAAQRALKWPVLAKLEAAKNLTGEEKRAYKAEVNAGGR